MGRGNDKGDECDVTTGLKRGKRWAIAALMGLMLTASGLFPGANRAMAEGERPSLEILELGWDGHASMGGWSPMRLKVSGGAVDRDVMVEVALENEYTPDPATTIRTPFAAFAQELSLPAGATKEVTVWVPTTWQQVGTIRLRAGEEELEVLPFTFRMVKSPFWPLVGVLSADEQLSSTVGKVEASLQGLPTTINAARLKAEALPDLSERLKGLNAILVQGNAPANLSDPQRQAIAKWVESGGQLILAGGPDSALTAAVLPAGTLPITFGGVEMNADLSPLATFAGLPGATNLRGPAVKMQASEGRVLAGTAQQPLIWEKPIGRGRVTVLAVDPSLEPIASWEGTVPLLKSTLGSILPDENNPYDEKFRWMNMENDLVNRLSYGANTFPRSAYPDWKQVGLYLGGFALLAGPVIHLLFWKNRRRGWVWLAVPVASLLVTGGIYATGVAMGGKDLLVNNLSYVRIDAATQTASQVSMVGVYAPMHEDLSIKLLQGQPVQATSAGNAYYGPWSMPEPTTKPPYRMVNGLEDRMEFFGGQWNMRSLTYSRILGSATGQIKADLTVEEGVIKGTITNETPYHLEDAAVAVGQAVARLGNLAPGASAEISLEPKAQNDMYGYVSISQLFYGEKITDELILQRWGPRPPGAPEPMEVPQDSEIQRRAQVLEAMMQEQTRFGGYTMPLLFAAFTQEPIGEPVANLAGHPQHNLNLIRQDLQLTLSGPFRLPPAMIRADMELVGTNGWGGGSDGTGISWTEMDRGQAIFTFDLPIGKGTEVTALEITTQLMGQPTDPNVGMPPMQNFAPGGNVEGFFQIFNWRSGVWENLPADQTEAHLTEVAPYVSSENKVRVQINTNGKSTRFIWPKLTVEGRGSK